MSGGAKSLFSTPQLKDSRKARTDFPIRVGLIMTSATTFRIFFVARTTALKRRETEGPPRLKWSSRICKIFSTSIARVPWFRLHNERSNDGHGIQNSHTLESLPHIPTGRMVSIRSFIRGNGRSSRLNISRSVPAGNSAIQSQVDLEGGHEDQSHLM